MFSPTKKSIVFLLAFCVAFLLFFFCFHPVVTLARRACLDVVRLPLVAVNLVSHEARALLFFHRHYWQNLSLSRRNEDLRLEVRRLENAAAENDRLRVLLDLKKRAGPPMTAAAVIGRDFNAFRPFIVIDKGARAGIKKSAPVLTSTGLVGKIFETGRYSAKVILINDPDLAVPAMIERTGEHGLIRGTLDGRCQLRFLGLDSDIQTGDVVVTSGLNMTYPPNVAIGRVKVVGIEPSGISKFAILEPAARLASLREVLVVLENPKT